MGIGGVNVWPVLIGTGYSGEIYLSRQLGGVDQQVADFDFVDEAIDLLEVEAATLLVREKVSICARFRDAANATSKSGMFVTR